MKNKMKQVAEILGVPITENINELKVFKIKFKNKGSMWQEVFLTKGGMYLSGGQALTSIYLESLITGQCEVRMPPYVPKDGDRYWRVWFTEKSRFCSARIWVTRDEWTCCYADYLNKHIGNCFATKTEAEAAKYDIYKRITGKEWQE